MTVYTAQPCPCGHPACKSWFVDPVAAVQGVNFTEEQATMVAIMLNSLREVKEARKQRDND